MARFWIGGSGNWSDTAHWSTTSGGSGGASVPDSATDVTINSSSGFSSGGTITIDTDANCKNFVSSTGHSYMASYGGGDFYIYGSATFESGFTDDDSYLNFLGTGSHTITSNGALFTNQVIAYFSGAGTYTLQDNFEVDSGISIENGTFNANGKNVTAFSVTFTADTGKIPTVQMGAGVWTLTGANDVLTVNTNNGETPTVTPSTSTIKIVDDSATPKNFNGLNKTFHNLWLSGDLLVVNGSNTFSDIKIDAGKTVNFQGGSTQTISTLTANGTAGNLITLTSTSDVSFALSKSSGTVICDYLDLSNSNAVGGAEWYATNSTDNGNNSGWIFDNKLFKVGTNNYFSTTLNGAINDTVKTITLTSVAGLRSPGVLRVEDEVISYLNISGNSLLSCVRGIGGSTATSHANLAEVSERLTVNHWNGFLETLLVGHSTDGTHKTHVSNVATYAPLTAGTTTLDLNRGSTQVIFLPEADQTLEVINAVAGMVFIVEINNTDLQGALTWFNTIRWSGGHEPTLTGTSGTKDVFVFRATSDSTFDGGIVGQNL